MRKWNSCRWILYLAALIAMWATQLPGQLSTAILQRAQADLIRIQELVAQGTLPRTSLEAAQERVDDAQDEVTLAETLYSGLKLQDISQEQEASMVAASSRRLERAKQKLQKRQMLLDLGIISQAEMAGARQEVTERQLVADLSRNRVKLLDDLKAMAAQEQRMDLPTIKNSMIRYDGTAAFRLADLPGIEAVFKRRFLHELPVSAQGQTPVHQMLGLDHRDKVDVALNPEQPEGLWLRRYLEARHVPYLAFRNAVSGAATGAHIHIGAGSPRLPATGRPSLTRKAGSASPALHP